MKLQTDALAAIAERLEQLRPLCGGDGEIDEIKKMIEALL